VKPKYDSESTGSHHPGENLKKEKYQAVSEIK
jgi:hypothetical protein